MKNSSSKYLIRTRNLNIRFELPNLNPHDLLSNVSLTLTKNNIHFLVGGNGTGKTSLLKTLLGLMPENSRSDDKVIEIANGSAISGIDLPKRMKIGYIPQHPHEGLVPSFNVSENISFRTFLRNNVGFSDWLVTQRYGKELEEKIEAMVSSFQITKDLLSDKLHNGIGHLSGGEQQILNLAAMIFDECELLVMDEPTSKLDEQNRRRFWDFIREIKGRQMHTMLIVTHEKLSDDLYDIADIIYSIDRGSVGVLGSGGES